MGEEKSEGKITLSNIIKRQIEEEGYCCPSFEIHLDFAIVA